MAWKLKNQFMWYNISIKNDQLNRHRKPIPPYDKSIQQQIQSNCLILIKRHLWDHSKCHTNGETLNALSLRSDQQTRMSALATLSNTVLDVPSMEFWQKLRRKPLTLDRKMAWSCVYKNPKDPPTILPNRNAIKTYKWVQ